MAKRGAHACPRATRSSLKALQGAWWGLGWAGGLLAVTLRELGLHEEQPTISLKGLGGGAVSSLWLILRAARGGRGGGQHID